MRISELAFFHSGKVRDTYMIPDYPNLLFVVASDRLSTHNVVHLSEVPFKGDVLTAITIFWLRDILPQFKNHLVASGREIFKYLPEGIEEKYPDLQYRALVINKLEMIAFEFIFRTYLMGSLLKEYANENDPYGLNLPEGLQLMSRFPEGVIFTPTDKSETDDPVLSSDIELQFPAEVALGREAYDVAQDYAQSRGVTIIDTKLEMSHGGCLADEVFTPDSSRYAHTKNIVEGSAPIWLDKQVFRDEAEDMWEGGKKVPLTFDSHVIQEGSETYLDLLQQLTDSPFSDWKEKHFFDFHI